MAIMAIQSESEVPRGHIVSVKAGDEFLLVTSDGSRVAVRLAGVTAPRGGSEIAEASRRSLEGLSAGYSVEVKVTGHAYDQVIGEASMGSWNLAETQANRGMVTVEHNWFVSAHDKLLEAEGYAKQRDAGVWRERPG